MLEITISGQTPAQKNSKSIAYNRGTGKPFIMSNQNVKSWQNIAAVELLSYRRKEPLKGRQELSVVFYVKDNRRRDLDNMLTTIQDALVKAGIIEDDSWKSLKIGGVDAQLDKLNPRAEITLKSVDEVI
jgi:Holliday junction resolvase RusA-like endonuclease